MPLINIAPKVSAEEQRIAASNERRDFERHRGYTIELRSDVSASRQTIERLRKEADEIEKVLTKRAERLKDAEKKLARMTEAQLRKVA